MEFEEARKAALQFLKEEFGLRNLETFLARNAGEGYAVFKRRFVNLYGQELLKKFDIKTLKNLGGRVRDIFAAENQNDFYEAIDQCAEVFAKNSLFASNGNIIMKYSDIASNIYSFTEELKGFSGEAKSELEQKVIPEEPDNSEKRLYHLLGSCLSNGHDKTKLDEASRLCRMAFYGKNKETDNKDLRLAYRCLISDLLAGKDGQERYAQLASLRKQ